MCSWSWLQAEQEDACTSIGNLFDESITEAADSANFQDFGAADEADLTGLIPSYRFLPSLDKLCCGAALGSVPGIAKLLHDR